MKVQIYDTDHSRTLESVEIGIGEVPQYIALIKEHGYESEDGEEYAMTDSKVCFGGFVIYVSYK